MGGNWLKCFRGNPDQARAPVIDKGGRICLISPGCAYNVVKVLQNYPNTFACNVIINLRRWPELELSSKMSKETPKIPHLSHFYSIKQNVPRHDNMSTIIAVHSHGVRPANSIQSSTNRHVTW